MFKVVFKQNEYFKQVLKLANTVYSEGYIEFSDKGMSIYVINKPQTAVMLVTLSNDAFETIQHDNDSIYCTIDLLTETWKKADKLTLESDSEKVNLKCGYKRSWFTYENKKCEHSKKMFDVEMPAVLNIKTDKLKESIKGSKISDRIRFIHSYDGLDVRLSRYGPTTPGTNDYYSRCEFKNEDLRESYFSSTIVNNCPSDIVYNSIFDAAFIIKFIKKLPKWGINIEIDNDYPIRFSTYLNVGEIHIQYVVAPLVG